MRPIASFPKVRISPWETMAQDWLDADQDGQASPARSKRFCQGAAVPNLDQDFCACRNTLFRRNLSKFSNTP